MKRIIIYLLIGESFLFLNLWAQPTQNNVAYGDNPLQKLDFYAASNINSPIIIIVHGGGWWAGDKSGYPYVNAAKLFNNQGYAVININYRLSPAVTFPTHISDLACALSWVKHNASLFNGDSSRIVLFGHSAGGQMTAYLGTNPQSNLLTNCEHNSALKVAAVLLTSATVDFDKTNPTGWVKIKEMLGDSAAFWIKAQPIHHTRNDFDTKFLILCENLDDLWYEQDFAFNDSLIDNGHCSSVKLFNGEDHQTLIKNLSPSSIVFKTMISFLDSLIYLYYL